MEVIPHITQLERVADASEHIVNTRSLSTDDLRLISDVLEQLAGTEQTLRYIASSLDERALLSIRFIDSGLDITVAQDEINLINSDMYSVDQYPNFGEALAQVISYSKDSDHSSDNSDNDDGYYEDEWEGYGADSIDDSKAKSSTIMVCSPALKYVEIWVNIDPESCREVDAGPSAYPLLRSSYWYGVEVENPLDLFVGEGGYVISRT